MTFTYSGDPSASNKDQVRFLVADTDATSPVLSDEEINWIISECSSSIPRAALAAAEEVLSRLARQVDKSVGDLRISASQRHAQYKETVARLRKKAGRGIVPFAGGISKADKETRAEADDRVEPAFTRDLHSFPTDPFSGDDYLLRGAE